LKKSHSSGYKNALPYFIDCIRNSKTYLLIFSVEMALDLMI